MCDAHTHTYTHMCVSLSLCVGGWVGGRSGKVREGGEKEAALTVKKNQTLDTVSRDAAVCFLQPGDILRF